ncbi:hypothetical protein ACNKHT_01060 [Shigella flexneri]
MWLPRLGSVGAADMKVDDRVSRLNANICWRLSSRGRRAAVDGCGSGAVVWS